MATTLYPVTIQERTVLGTRFGYSRNTNDNPDIATTEGSSGWIPTFMQPDRGSSAASSATSTVTGPTAGIAWKGDGINPTEWVSDPVDQDVTISGTITFNLRSAETSMNANAAINALVYKVDAKTMAKTLICKTARTTELGTSEAAANFTATPTSTALNKGDRLLLVVWVDDASAVTMAIDSFTFFYNGPTAAASGDSFITFTETFGFLQANSTPTTFLGANIETTNLAGTSLGIGSVSGQDRIAQSFTTSSSGGGSCTRVVINLDADTGSPSDNLTVEIRTDNAGVPSSTVLATKTLTDAEITPGANAWNTFEFATPATLSASTTYWIVVSRQTTDTGNFRTWDRGSASTITGGVKISALSPESWSDATNPTFDMGFRLFVATTTIYPTDTDSDVDQSQVELEMWTSRGAAAKILPHYILETTNTFVTPTVLDGGYYFNFDTSHLVAEDGLRDPADRAAQSFVAKAGVISGIRTRLSKTGAPTDNLVVEIQGDSGGNPDGVAIGSVTKPATDSYASSIDLNFASPVSLTRGSTYWIVLRRDGALSNVNYLETLGRTSVLNETDFPGEAKYSDNSGGSWASGTNKDLNMAVKTGKEIHWYTKQLQAVTLAGNVDAFLRLRNTLNVQGAGSINCELAIVNSDGSSATVIALAGCKTSTGYIQNTEETYLFHCGVDDVSITDGQRIRMRLFWTSNDRDQRIGGSGTTCTTLFYYGSTTPATTGDSFIQFPVVLTEFTPAAAAVLQPGFVNFQDPGVL